MNQSMIDALLQSGHSTLRNYALPGLTSRLLGSPKEDGSRFRIFQMERTQHECIAPHSHRYDFKATVLRGWVQNIIWLPDQEVDDPEDCDRYETTELTYTGEPGCYQKLALGVRDWVHFSSSYSEGESYSMTAKQVHSIIFSRGAVVLMEEGPRLKDTSIMLEPFVVDFGKVPTGDTLPWMFKRFRT